MKKYYIYLLLILITLSSCVEQSKTNKKKFPFEKYLKVDLVKDLNEYSSLINPSYLFIKNNLLYIVSHSTDTLYFVLDLPSMEINHGFGTRGQGPDEFLLPNFYHSQEDNKLFLRGYNNYFMVKEFEIKPINEYELIDQFELTCGRVWNEVYLLNDSLLIFNDSDTDTLPIVNYRKDSIVDYIYFTEQDNYHSGSLHINHGVLSSNGDFMVYAYRNKRQIDIFDSSFQLVESIIGDYKPTAYRYSFDDEKIYYLDIQACKKYFYCMYSGKTPFYDVDDPNREYALEVYTYDGNPVGKYIFNKNIPATFVVDEKSGYLYGFSGLEDGILYRYKLDIFD